MTDMTHPWENAVKRVCLQTKTVNRLRFYDSHNKSHLGEIEFMADLVPDAPSGEMTRLRGKLTRAIREVANGQYTTVSLIPEGAFVATKKESEIRRQYVEAVLQRGKVIYEKELEKPDLEQSDWKKENSS
jgi:hypothetical protein